MPWIYPSPELGPVWVDDDPSLLSYLNATASEPKGPTPAQALAEPQAKPSDTVTALQYGPGGLQKVTLPTSDPQISGKSIAETPNVRTGLDDNGNPIKSNLYTPPAVETPTFEYPSFEMPSFEMPSMPSFVIPEYPQYPTYPTMAGSAAVAKKASTRTNKIAKLTLLSDQKSMKKITLGSSGSASTGTTGKKKLLGA